MKSIIIDYSEASQSWSVCLSSVTSVDLVSGLLKKEINKTQYLSVLGSIEDIYSPECEFSSALEAIASINLLLVCNNKM